MGNDEVILKKGDKVLTPDEIKRLGISVHKTEPVKGSGNVKKPFSEFVEQFEILMETYDESEEPDEMEEDGAMNTFGLGQKHKKMTEELKRIYTPILITQKLEGDLSTSVKESVGDDEFTERNIIKFDSESRIAQLIDICAVMICRWDNLPEYRLFIKAKKIAKDMRARMNERKHAAAVSLAKKYLEETRVSGTSQTAKDAASELLSSTNWNL